VYAPELLDVVAALVAPLKVSVAAFPPATGVIVPEMLNVGPLCTAAVKLTPLTFAPLTVAF
jgi:hypothetical protein